MKRFLTVCLCCFSLALSAQIKFEAAVSKSTVALNERFRVEFTMNEDGDNFVPPDFEASGFQIFSGPSQSIRELWVNGRGTFNKTYTYFLVPEKKGTLVIKAAAIEINNRIYRTNPVKITVTNAVDPRNDPNNAPVARNSAMYLVTEVSNSSPFVNEPVQVVQKLYFNYNTEINDARDIQKPRYNDFWNQDIEISMFEPVPTVYKGQRCLSVVLKKAVVYPQKSGKLVIDPYVLEVDCRIPTGRMTIFGEMITTENVRRLTSSGKTITVKALPETGKPKNFTGAVGDFTFEALSKKNTIKFGESFDLALKVTGEGNLKLFRLPVVELPENLEVYDPEHIENVVTPFSGMSGTIADRYTIVPQEKGTFSIKKLAFSYFDLKTKSYKTITLPDILLTVKDGPGLPAGGYAGKGKNNATEKTATFAPLKLETELHPIATHDFLGSVWYYLLLLLPLLGIPIAIYVRKRKMVAEADIVGNKMRLNSALAKKYLSEAQKNLNQKEPFYVALEKALHNFLKAKLHLETADMSKETIRGLMKDKGADAITLSEFMKLIENCEFARYAPSSAAAIQSDYETAVRLLTELEKQMV